MANPEMVIVVASLMVQAAKLLDRLLRIQGFGVTDADLEALKAEKERIDAQWAEVVAKARAELEAAGSADPATAGKPAEEDSRDVLT